MVAIKTMTEMSIKAVNKSFVQKDKVFGTGGM